ncbi:MAG: hypothetical protein EOP84_13265 [Verrucomicrobiaceae bacterium]|nr:MAG: hypothetical protein EOP84_13265 [Verrucomicrobiaceae bacterium]
MNALTQLSPHSSRQLAGRRVLNRKESEFLMRASLITILLTLALAHCACASDNPVIVISTEDAQTRYRIVQPWNNDKNLKTTDEVGTWLSESYKEWPEFQKDMLLIYADDRTSFATVSSLLIRLKTAGLKQFMVGRAYSDGDIQVFDYIRGETDKIGVSRHPRPPAKK